MFFKQLCLQNTICRKISICWIIDTFFPEISFNTFFHYVIIIFPRIDIFLFLNLAVVNGCLLLFLFFLKIVNDIYICLLHLYCWFFEGLLDSCRNHQAIFCGDWAAWKSVFYWSTVLNLFCLNLTQLWRFEQLSLSQFIHFWLFFNPHKVLLWHYIWWISLLFIILYRWNFHTFHIFRFL